MSVGTAKATRKANEHQSNGGIPAGRLSGSRKKRITRHGSATTGESRNRECHVRNSTRNPPSSGLRLDPNPMKKLQIAIMSLRDSGGTTTNRMRAERLRNSPPPNPASAYHRVISVSEPEEAAPTPAPDTTQSARKRAPRRPRPAWMWFTSGCTSPMIRRLPSASRPRSMRSALKSPESAR